MLGYDTLSICSMCEPAGNSFWPKYGRVIHPRYIQKYLIAALEGLTTTAGSSDLRSFYSCPVGKAGHCRKTLISGKIISKRLKRVGEGSRGAFDHQMHNGKILELCKRHARRDFPGKEGLDSRVERADLKGSLARPSSK